MTGGLIGVDGLAMAPMASMAPGFIDLTVRGHPLASPVVCGNGAMHYVTLVRTPDPHFDWIDQRECPRFRFPCPPYAGNAPSKPPNGGIGAQPARRQRGDGCLNVRRAMSRRRRFQIVGENNDGRRWRLGSNVNGIGCLTSMC